MPAGLASILLDIKTQTGWGAFSRTFKYFGGLPESLVPQTEGGKLNLFLTQLKKYSGKDVFGMITAHDKEVLKANFGEEIKEYVVPAEELTGGVLGRIADMSVQKGDYKQYQFIPSETGTYSIYTSRYGGTGVPNDTYIEVHSENTETGTPLKSNDDYNGSRFSRVDMTLTKGVTYYVKVFNYNQSNNRLHARLNVVKSEPEEELILDNPVDVGVKSTQFRMYRFKAPENGKYIFKSDKTGTNDTYIKLYAGRNQTELTGQGDSRIECNLMAGHTYYLQFSGFLMKESQGRVMVTQPNTLKFTKRSDSSFIYVNNPEYIANEDIVDDENNTDNSKKRKLFEQKNVYGKNTYYQANLAWYNSTYNSEYYPNGDSFYVGIDFYNPNSYSVSLTVSNLVACENKTYLKDYINRVGENPEMITILPHEHVQLFDYTEDKFICHRVGELPSLFIIFDFDIKKASGANITDGQGITLSTLVAYNYENMRLKNGEENVLNYNNMLLNNGEVLYGEFIRPTESDLDIKYKGIARNQSNQIDIDLDFSIDDNTYGGIPLRLKDNGNLINGYYSKEQTDWNVQINPINDQYDSLLHTTVDNLHKFKYRYNDSKTWYFDYRHRKTSCLTAENDETDSINQEVPQDIIKAAQSSIISGVKTNEARDENALEMGSWGVVYHYNVTVDNTGTRTKTIKYRVRTTAHYTIIGIRESDSDIYTFKDTGNNTEYQMPFEVDVPPGQTTFEIVTLCGGGHGGLENAIVVE